MITLYDIVNDSTGETLVPALSSHADAYEVYVQMMLDPALYTIVERTVSTVKPGFGRDPDLH